jgi:hypothetical protein
MAVLPEMAEVANVYKKLSQYYIVNGKSGWTKPPYKTGNLYRTVGSYNTVSNMITNAGKGSSNTDIEIKDQSFSLKIEYAPPGAKYGKFVHDGHNTRNINKSARRFIAGRAFTDAALNDPIMKRAIDNAINGIIDKNIIPVIDIGINRAFNRM